MFLALFVDILVFLTFLPRFVCSWTTQRTKIQEVVARVASRGVVPCYWYFNTLLIWLRRFMVSSIFNICSCFLYFTELTWLQNKIENNPLHCCLDWYWFILLGYTRCCDVFFMVSNARGTGTWTNVKFPPTCDLICVKCPGVARVGDAHSWIWLMHNYKVVLNNLWKSINFWNNRSACPKSLKPVVKF